MLLVELSGVVHRASDFGALKMIMRYRASLSAAISLDGRDIEQSIYEEKAPETGFIPSRYCVTVKKKSR